MYYIWNPNIFDISVKDNNGKLAITMAGATASIEHDKLYRVQDYYIKDIIRMYKPRGLCSINTSLLETPSNSPIFEDKTEAPAEVDLHKTFMNKKLEGLNEYVKFIRKQNKFYIDRQNARKKLNFHMDEIEPTLLERMNEVLPDINKEIKRLRDNLRNDKIDKTIFPRPSNSPWTGIINTFSPDHDSTISFNAETGEVSGGGVSSGKTIVKK